LRKKKERKKRRPAIFALRVPKAVLKKAVTAPQLVVAFLSTALANLEGG
jgi:hypothetical protein